MEQPQQYIYIPQPGLGNPDRPIPPEPRQGSGHSTPSPTPWVPPSMSSSLIPHIPSPFLVNEDPFFDNPTPTSSFLKTVFSPPHPSVKRAAPETSQKSSLSDRHQHKCYDLDGSTAGRLLLDDPLFQNHHHHFELQHREYGYLLHNNLMKL